ncbi:hypothetical protein D3C85_839210 [compost metagenome]
MAGADVETEVEPPGQLVRQGGKRLPHLGHQQPGHGDYEAAILRERNEAIRRDHALAGMLPAHQHLAAAPVRIVPGHHGLQVGNELLLIQRPLQLLGRGGRSSRQPEDPHPEQQAQQGIDDDADLGVVPDMGPVLTDRYPGHHLERIPGRALLQIALATRGDEPVGELAVPQQHLLADHQAEGGVAAQHVQNVEQVVTIYAHQHAERTDLLPVDDEGTIRGDGIALHEIQLAIRIVAQPDLPADRPIEGGAVDGRALGQVDAAHIRHRRHLIPQPLHHLEAGFVQAAAKGRRRHLGVVQSTVKHQPGMLQPRHRILPHPGGGLPDDDGQSQHHGQQTRQQGTDQPDIELTHP